MIILRQGGRRGATVILATMAFTLAGALGAQAAGLACDDTLKEAFKPDADTTVLAVKAFKKDDPLLLSGEPGPQTGKALNDLCLVKLLVGPGNPGPADAPSTSAGIGIEVWLPAPANWNKRLHALGGGGWVGGNHASPDIIQDQNTGGTSAAMVAALEGAVTAITDTGHSAPGASFAMNPDGSINTVLWKDFAERGVQQMAIQSKALATAYYGEAPAYSYWDGFSTGGRQGMKLAQLYPDLFDGNLIGAPVVNWTRFITAELNPQLVYQQDLGGTPPTEAQLDYASNAAIAACDTVGGEHLGYIMDPASCNYDAAADAAILCPASGGTSNSPDCLSTAQATALNKIWYGQTVDGTIPSVAEDNGWADAASGKFLDGKQRWFGFAKGTSLYSRFFSQFGMSGPSSPKGPFPIAAELVALELEDPTLAPEGFVNATGNGASGYKKLTYADLNRAFDRGIELQSQFGDINTDQADLSAAEASGARILHYHGLADDLVPPANSVNYNSRVLAEMGDAERVKAFYRFFQIPGMGHYPFNGTSNPEANPPMPGPTQLYDALVAWVEKGEAPETLTLSSPPGGATSISQPICAYPAKATFASGDPKKAESYSCS